MLKDVKAVEISCRNNHNAIMENEGKIYIWGSIMNKSEMNPVELKRDVFLSKIFCGDENILGIISTKNLPTLCYTSFSPPTIKCGTIE